MMSALGPPILIYFAIVMVVICVYGLHRYWLVCIYLRRGGRRTPPKPFTSLPRVTVQLPMFNECNVAERAISAACGLEYPRELLQIQVLDDSTDESAELVRRCVERHRAAGHDVTCIHRTVRDGYKAGALAHGTESTTGEFIAVFDADFVPPPDFLRKTIHEFTDPRIGMVQGRWTHLNRCDSLLTRIQGLLLDGHFVIEQIARSASGCWFNFNGTAGVWRRSCIEDAGGWQHDTLTEDTDLSYRAQLRGWRFRYLPDVCCPAEVPPTVSAFLSQQHRWNKGLMQTAIKLLPTILRSNAPLRMKIEAWFHLTSPLVHVVILLLALLALPALLYAAPVVDMVGPMGALIGCAVLAFGAVSASVFYVTSQIRHGRGALESIALLPALMAVGIGISVVNTKAVIEAIMGFNSPFIRTPKYNGRKTSESDPLVRRRWLLPRGVVETLLGVLMLACVLMAMKQPHSLIGIPFMILFATGFLAIGTPLVHASLRRA